jgi:hypothetical protein
MLDIVLYSPAKAQVVMVREDPAVAGAVPDPKGEPPPHCALTTKNDPVKKRKRISVFIEFA